jgi:hypothetical protein
MSSRWMGLPEIVMNQRLIEKTLTENQIATDMIAFFVTDL